MRRAFALVAALAFGCSASPTPGTDAATADRVDAALNDLGGADVTDAGGPADAGMDVAPPPTIEPFAPTPRGRFPQGFLWGSATAPYQIEGGLGNTDWGAWERMPGRILGGDRADNGPRSYELFAADLDALVASGQNSYRLGIEWARIFPTRDAWTRCQAAASMPLSQFTAACRAAASAEGVAYYHRVLRAMADRRLVPMVTLQHFTLPDYLHDINADAGMQGWNRPEIVGEFAVWARFAGAEYGAEVDWWVTINEPVVTVAGGFLQGVFPPGRSTDFTSARTILRHMTLAHARAYDALHEADTTAVMGQADAGGARPCMVSIASHNRVFRANDPNRPEDVAAAETTQYVNNRLMLNAIVGGDLDGDADGTLDGPEDRRNDPTLRARADYIGVNYYGLTLVRGISIIPILRGLPEQVNLRTPLPKSDLLWDLYPQGFLLVLRELTRYNLPVLVTENGIADRVGVNRQRFLAEHLAILARAIREGIDVRGYYHWSIVDNFEWAEGFCPRFGLYTVDFNDPMRARVPTPAAMLYRRIITEGEVTDTLLNGLAPYQAPVPCHPTDAGM
ncbi:MAG: glycoside hydrolase family 1 protein [Polyangiales bacterium]